jgi:hypothetical protein
VSAEAPAAGGGSCSLRRRVSVTLASVPLMSCMMSMGQAWEVFLKVPRGASKHLPLATLSRAPRPLLHCPLAQGTQKSLETRPALFAKSAKPALQGVQECSGVMAVNGSTKEAFSSRHWVPAAAYVLGAHILQVF